MEIFLSYPSERLKIARQVYDFLTPLGVRVWFDKASLIPGQEWDLERERAQERADLTILICSPETIARAGVIQREIKDVLRLMKDKPAGQIFLISIRTDDVRLPPELAKYHYLDYFKEDWQQQLCRSLDQRYREVNEAPPRALDQLLVAYQSPDTRREAKFGSQVVAEFFSYNVAAEYWTFVNATITSRAMAWFYKQKWFVLRYPARHRWSLRTEEFFRQGEFASLRLFSTGSASIVGYPSDYVICLNFGASELGLFSLEDLFEGNRETLRYLVKYCKLDLERQNLSLDAQIEFYKFSAHDDEITWRTLSSFNFDGKGLTFNFPVMEVLEHDYGAQEVFIPWRQIKDKLSEKILVNLSEIIDHDPNDSR